MALAPAIPYATVPRLWPDETAVILGSGPSLALDDVEYCREKARVIAVKDAIRLAPDADVLYGCGLDTSHWWARIGPTLSSFTGLRYTLDPAAAQWAQVLRQTGEAGLELDPSGLRTGKNSVYQAVNLAVHLGIRRILLLGVDMGHSPHSPKYFFGDRKWQPQSPYHAMLALWPTILPPLSALGIELVNCSRETALESVPRRPLREVL